LGFPGLGALGRVSGRCASQLPGGEKKIKTNQKHRDGALNKRKNVGTVQNR